MSDPWQELLVKKLQNIGRHERDAMDILHRIYDHVSGHRFQQSAERYDLDDRHLVGFYRDARVFEVFAEAGNMIDVRAGGQGPIRCHTVEQALEAMAQIMAEAIHRDAGNG